MADPAHRRCLWLCPLLAQLRGERATLVRYLRDRRLTLELKCAGLDAAGMARRSVEPSNLSLLGLVRHLAGVEQYWFRKVLAGQDVQGHYRSDARHNGHADFLRERIDGRVGQ